jgi:hypothetical protein
VHKGTACFEFFGKGLAPKPLPRYGRGARNIKESIINGIICACNLGRKSRLVRGEKSQHSRGFCAKDSKEAVVKFKGFSHDVTGSPCNQNALNITYSLHNVLKSKALYTALFNENGATELINFYSNIHVTFKFETHKVLIN